MTVVLLRHASAGDRDDWAGDDRLRPLDERGRRQAQRLAEELRGAGRVISSPYLRCVQTVEPLGRPVETDDRLAEGASLEGVQSLLEEVDDAVLCTHGDVCELLGYELKKGAYVRLRSRGAH
jgi:8-oxo-dGTP diphosphatase